MEINGISWMAFTNESQVRVLCKLNEKFWLVGFKFYMIKNKKNNNSEHINKKMVFEV